MALLQLHAECNLQSQLTFLLQLHAHYCLEFELKLLLQVHDELIFEVPHQEMDFVTQGVKRIMESVETLKVPLTVGIGQGTTWEDAH